MLAGDDRKTVGGYFDARIASPHKMTGTEGEYPLRAKDFNAYMPNNLYIIVGDPSLELQAQVISQIGGQTLPPDTWKNVHNWLRDLIAASVHKLGGEDSVRVLIDCNPSFSAYTELSMMAADRLIVPCSSDGSSARAIDNVGALLYGVGTDSKYQEASFKSRAEKFEMPLPQIHSVLLNRSTWYSDKASKAFGAMFKEIKRRTNKLFQADKKRFVFDGKKFWFHEIPDSHSVAIVCSHLGKPLYDVSPGKVMVHDANVQVNSEPLNRYKKAVAEFLAAL
jgi:cellulose biosynthesis protein BcsQ